MNKLLNETQRKYAITEKECFSMVYAVEYFRPCLDQEFVIVTDHCALCWLKTKDKLTSKLERWATILQGFNYTVRYKSGKVHKDANCLSRNYLSLPVPELNETNLFAYANIEFGVSYIGELQHYYKGTFSAVFIAVIFTPRIKKKHFKIMKNST
jgi:hypothetical protein